MSQQLFTVEQVAQSLKLHVRTVRNYVRAGSLKATRIGKQYRIARADLEAFTGSPVSASANQMLGAYSSVDVSSVVQIDAVTQDAVARLTNLLVAAAKGHRSGGRSLSVTTAYDEGRDRLKIIVSGDLQASTEVLKMIEVLVPR